MKLMIDFEKSKFIDLTHTIHPEIPGWDRDCGFESHITVDYEDSKSKTSFRVQEFKMKAGIGAHLDAPAHCVLGAKTIEKISLNELIAPCVVIDVAEKTNESYRVSVADILEFEKKIALEVR